MNYCIVYPDCLFSNWIIVWYIFFVLNIVKFNPKYFLCFALIINFFQILVKIKNKSSLENILFFILSVSILKLLPLLFIIHTESNFNDILFGILLFFLYTVYIFINFIFKRLEVKMLDILFTSDKQRKCQSFLEYILSTNNS
jgi:hypothetical protein